MCFVKKGVLNNFANFTVKHLYWSLFLIKLQVFKPGYLLKRDSNTGKDTCEQHCDIFKNTCSEVDLRTTSSIFLKSKLQIM